MRPIRSDSLGCVAVVDDLPCRHVCTVIRKIQDHCTRKHGWKNVQKRGGDVRNKVARASNRLWREGQSYQQYLPAIAWKKYIPVSVCETDDTTAAEAKAQRHRQANQMFDEYEQNVREARAQHAIYGDEHRLIADSWLSFTRWASQLSPFTDPDPVDAYGENAADEDGEGDDRGLEVGCRGTRRLIRPAFATSTPTTVNKAALESVNLVKLDPQISMHFRFRLQILPLHSVQRSRIA